MLLYKVNFLIYLFENKKKHLQMFFFYSKAKQFATTVFPNKKAKLNVLKFYYFMLTSP